MSAQALQAFNGSTLIQNMEHVGGDIDGFVVDYVSGLCGEGTGAIRTNAGNASFKAPGSAKFGEAVDVSAGGAFNLFDGDDTNKYVSVTVSQAFIQTGQEKRIFTKDRYSPVSPGTGMLVNRDVTAAEASAGNVLTASFTIKNVSSFPIYDVRAWIDPAVSFLEISDDGSVFVAPTSANDPNVLIWSSIDAGATKTVWWRRTIPASTSSSTKKLHDFRFQWQGI